MNPLEITSAFGVVAWVLFALFLIILSVLWVILPFLVFSMNEKMKTIVRLLESSDSRLDSIERKQPSGPDEAYTVLNAAANQNRQFPR